MTDRRPYTAKIGMDALVERADGSTINFGDAIYHPENEEEARVYALAASEPSEPERLARDILRVRDFLALRRLETGRSDVNIRQVIGLLDAALSTGDKP